MGLIGRTVRPRIVKIPRLADAELAGLKGPMLVIAGGRDVLIDSEDTRRRVRAHAPHAEVAFLPEARHFIPGQTARIMAFLQG